MIYSVTGADKQKIEDFMKENGYEFKRFTYAAELVITNELEFQINEARLNDSTPETNKKLNAIEGSMEEVVETLWNNNEYLFAEIENTVSDYLKSELGELPAEVEDVVCNGGYHV